MALSLERINKARESGYDDDKIIESIERRDPEFGGRIKKAREAGYDSQAIMQSIERRLSRPDSQSQMDQNQMTADTQQPMTANTQGSMQAGTSTAATPASFLANQVSPTSRPPMFAQPQQAKQDANSIAPKELSREELKALSFEERQQYAEDLNRYMEYQRSKGFTKGIASGLTFGLSEKIPALKPQEDEHGVLFGELLGSILPIEGIAKVIGYPLIKLAGQSPKYKAGLEAFARMAGLEPLLQAVGHTPVTKAAIMGATGAVYEGTKKAVKTGELPTVEDLAKHGVEWAAFDAVIQGFGMASWFAKAVRESGGNTTSKINEVISKVNLKEKNPELLKKEITTAVNEVFPERISLSKEELSAAKSKTGELIEQLPEGNKKKLAEKALQRDQVRTPEQLEGFLDSYQENFSTIAGKTVNDKNRKFLNKISDKNVRERKIDLSQPGAENVPKPKMSEQEKLIRAKVELKEARKSGEKNRIKEAKKRVDLQKRKMERQSIEDTKKTSDIKVASDIKKPDAQSVIKEDLSSIGEMGTAMSDNYYRQAFESLQQGKSAVSGVKDEFLEAAKINYDAGFIKSEADLRKFRDAWDIKFNKKPFNEKTTEKTTPEVKSAKVKEAPKTEAAKGEKTEVELQVKDSPKKTTPESTSEGTKKPAEKKSDVVVEKEKLKEFESKVESKETKSIQKKIDSIQSKLGKTKNTSQIKALRKNLIIQKKNLELAKKTRKKSVPQTPAEVNTKDPTLVAENPQSINNPNVIQAISEKPVETLAQGAYTVTGQYPGFQSVTNFIKSTRRGVRSAVKWAFKKSGQEVLRANPESSIYKTGKRAVEDYFSTKMGLKERFFTKWRDSIGKNKNITRQDREDMIFYRERTGNPFIKGDTFEALSKRMSSDSKHVVDTFIDDHMKETLRLINESPFMQGKEVSPRQAVEDIYIRHFYSGKISTQKTDAIFESMQKRFGTDNPFKNKRTFLTFDQALQEAGLVPKFRDITQNLAAQDGMLTRVLSNNELVSNLHDIEQAAGQKMIVRSTDKKAYKQAKEDGWIQFQDPYMRSYVAGTSKSGKKNWAVTEAPALVHPDLASSLQGVFSKDAYKPDNAVLRLYDRVNSAISQWHVGMSLFHFNALGESFNPAGGFVTSIAMSPKWWKQGTRILQDSPFVEDAVRHGLKINRPTDLDLNQANTFYQKLLTTMQASKSLPIKGAANVLETANVFGRIHKFLFGEFQPRMKVITYDNYVNRMLKYYEKKGLYPNEELLREIKRESAKAVNDQFGGQVFELIPFMNDKHKGMHRLLSFPDWTVSAIREVSEAVGSTSPIRRKLGQRYLVEYLMGLTFGTQLLSYALTGLKNDPDGSITWDINKAHSTFENADPKRQNMFDIEMPDIYLNVAGDKINVGRDENQRKYFMHGGKKIREIYRYFHSPISALFSKSTPLIQNATKYALDYTPSEEGIFPVRGAYVEGEFRPWDGTHKHTVERAVSYAKEIASSSLPFSLQTAVTDLFDSKEQFIQALARTGFKFVTSGGGALSVGKGVSLRSSEPYWEEAFREPDKSKRDQSLKALRVLMKDYGYKPQQIKNIESKIKRRVEGKSERR